MFLINYSKVKPVFLVFILSCMILPKAFGKSNAVSQNECAKALTSVEKIDQILKAVKNNDPEGVEFFIKLHNIDGPQIDQMEALHHAARLGHTSIAVLLMQLGADPDFKTTDGTPYQIALDENNDEIANIIQNKTSNSKPESLILFINQPVIKTNNDAILPPQTLNSNIFNTALLSYNTLSKDARKVLKNTETTYERHEKAYEVTGPRTKIQGLGMFATSHFYMRAKVITKSKYQRELKTLQLHIEARVFDLIDLNIGYSEGKQLDLIKIVRKHHTGTLEHVAINLDIKELLEEFVKEKPFDFVLKNDLRPNISLQYSISNSYIRGFIAAFIDTIHKIDQES